MATRILWLEDDHLLGVEAALRDAGYEVERAFFLCDADDLFRAKAFDLVLLDALLAIEPEDIAAGYTVEETEGGHKAGLAFYKRHCQRMLDRKVGVLVYSIVGDEEDIRAQFIQEGLTEDDILYKVDDSSVGDLLQHIENALQRRGKHAGDIGH